MVFIYSSLYCNKLRSAMEGVKCSWRRFNGNQRNTFKPFYHVATTKN